MELRIQISAPETGGRNYEEAVRRAGGTPVSAYAPEADLGCAGLLLTGGGDLDPALFGAQNCGSQPPDPVRDRAELALFDAFYRAGRPILGICRGMQLINVALGGTLIQDLDETAAPFHTGRDRLDAVHPLRAAPGSALHDWYGPVFPVNSWHHQAVDALGAGLLPCAWAESGFVEGFMHTSAPILGVQFHPERMAYDRRRTDTADGAPVFEWLLRLCRAAAE